MADHYIKPVSSKRDLKKFIEVPDHIYSDDPNWIRPLKAERLEILDKKRNPYFRHAEAQYFIAYRNGKPAGRISAQIDRLALDQFGRGLGHFGFFECIEDIDAAKALISVAEGWLKSKGMDRIQGPFSLSINEECGMLIDGFTTPPRIMMGHARPYYQEFLEQMGFEKRRDSFAYDLDISKPFPKRIQRLVSAAEQNSRIHVRNLDTRNFEGELHRVMVIFNNAWSDNWGFIPFTDAEIAAAAKTMKPLIRPHLVRICEYDGRPAAFMITLPDLNSIISDLDGRLLPLGWAKILWRLKISNLREFRVPLMGVRKEFQRSPAGAQMAFHLIDSIRKHVAERGGKRAELSWVLEDNIGMRKMLEQIGGRIYKTYRIYEKPIY